MYLYSVLVGISCIQYKLVLHYHETFEFKSAWYWSVVLQHDKICTHSQL